ncbi:MAG: CAP domain-containing protein [Lachnospiraceae bacterium]|nr:CAP domain-containing protein [Lachnospiraceae bacterium]
MKKIIDLPVLLAICVFTGAVLMPDSTEDRISSVMRRFIVGTEEEAIYVVSASEEVPVSEMETVSGNTLGSLSTEAGEVFTQVNQARAEIGLPELAWSDELAAAAEVRAQEIHQSFSHTRPDGNPWWTVNSEIIYGENIARGYQSADSVVTAWMESSDHKDNILYSGFQTIGVAVYNVDGKWYWAQEFGY